MSVSPTASEVQQSARRPTTSLWRAAIAIALTAVSLFLFVHGVITNFGTLEKAGLAVTFGLLGATFVDRRLRIVPRLLLLATATYVTLVAADGVLSLISPRINHLLSVRGMYLADPQLGYRLQPGWTGHFDDGVVRNAQYTINALGQRDAMPAGPAAHRILLLGDSFTFGELLDDSETIDRQLEALTQARLDAYNLGVPGYGAPACERMLERTHVPAATAVYLFYENDLRNDGLEPERNTAWRGFPVTRVDAVGRLFSEDELDAKVERVLAHPNPVIATLQLGNVSRTAFRIAAAIEASGFTELENDDPGPLGYRRENAERVALSTVQMKQIAEARNMVFSVFIVPSAAEAKSGRHYALVDAYKERLRALHIEALDHLDRFSVDDFYLHNGHFNPKGAGKAAQILSERFGPKS